MAWSRESAAQILFFNYTLFSFLISLFTQKLPHLFQTSMASPKKSHLDTLHHTIVDSVHNADIELKAASFDISNKNYDTALQGIERVRRKLRATEGKSLLLMKEMRKDHASHQQKLHGMASREKCLMEKNHDICRTKCRCTRNRWRQCLLMMI